MFSSDEEEEEPTNEFFFWNNWKPPAGPIKTTKNGAVQIGNKYSTMKCWLPPVNFACQGDRRQTTKEDIECGNNLIDSSFVLKEEHFEWGSRLPYLKSLAAIEDNDIIWNLFHVNIFGVFKLWKNEYNSIIAYAEAEFENGIADEKAIVVINKPCHLRKLLGVSSDEWTALLEALVETSLTLSYDALNVRNDHNSAPLENLWRFLCRRRHYLPCVSIKMRRLGVKKLTQYLKILPKFVAEEIKTFNGADIP